MHCSNSLMNTQLFALSDDMLLGQRHAAADIFSPLFGPVMGFKTNAYNTINPPTEIDAHRFGEKVRKFVIEVARSRLTLISLFSSTPPGCSIAVSETASVRAKAISAIHSPAVSRVKQSAPSLGLSWKAPASASVANLAFNFTHGMLRSTIPLNGTGKPYYGVILCSAAT